MSAGIKKLLSTRLLLADEIAQLVALGYQVDQLQSIEVELLNFDMPEFEYGIFTSQNALKAYDQNPLKKANIKAFCVGQKTAALAQSMGMQVLFIANNSEELADEIIQNYQELKLVYFAGSIAMRVLVEKLSKASIDYQEIVVYRTLETNNKAQGIYDVVLFFSPSGVRSYRANHDLKNSINLCIGPTTAAEITEECEVLIGAYPPSFSNMIKALANK